MECNCSHIIMRGLYRPCNTLITGKGVIIGTLEPMVYLILHETEALALKSQCLVSMSAFWSNGPHRIFDIQPEHDIGYGIKNPK